MEEERDEGSLKVRSRRRILEAAVLVNAAFLVDAAVLVDATVLVVSVPNG